MKSPSYLLLQVPILKPHLTCLHFLLIPKIPMVTSSFIQKALYGHFYAITFSSLHTQTHRHTLLWDVKIKNSPFYYFSLWHYKAKSQFFSFLDREKPSSYLLYISLFCMSSLSSQRRTLHSWHF